VHVDVVNSVAAVLDMPMHPGRIGHAERDWQVAESTYGSPGERGMSSSGHNDVTLNVLWGTSFGERPLGRTPQIGQPHDTAMLCTFHLVLPANLPHYVGQASLGRP
jgi:hypothetical protein